MCKLVPHPISMEPILFTLKNPVQKRPDAARTKERLSLARAQWESANRPPRRLQRVNGKCTFVYLFTNPNSAPDSKPSLTLDVDDQYYFPFWLRSRIRYRLSVRFSNSSALMKSRGE
ncbi:hypothetical protein EVAR_44658_1 [Eumeta japonica]|uniref:Uncharacterized protein n=1 Tax=Eumeta variegata TaxID=151549 RepID=A0A4C1XGM9_EUMVA|nr:hypothetical protein EVAR_44658_1 [Eumeta japonica]